MPSDGGGSTRAVGVPFGETRLCLRSRADQSRRGSRVRAHARPGINREVGNASRHHGCRAVTDKDPGPEPETPGTEPEKAPDRMPEEGLGDSIYGHTNTFYTAPKLNQGVPADPMFIRILSAIEITIGVTLF